MKIDRRLGTRVLLLISIMVAMVVLSARHQADTGTCSGQMITLPFTDLPSNNVFFCAIAEAYFSGLTNGTTATTYSPTTNVPREQMAAFVTRTLDQSLHRGSRRAALGQWWTQQLPSAYATGGSTPNFAISDGTIVYVSNYGGNSVSRTVARTGEGLATVMGITAPQGLLVYNSVLYACSYQSPGKVYRISTTDNAVSDILPTNAALGDYPTSLATDGRNLWTANFGAGSGAGSVSKVDLGVLGPPSGFVTTTYTAGFSRPESILFDGSNLWVADYGDAKLKRVSTADGTVLQTIPLSGEVGYMVFDGTNLWIPCAGPDQIYVVRAVGGLQGTVLAQLTGNGLSHPEMAAFDGERILVTNYSSVNTSVSLWKATDLTPIGTVGFGLNNGLPTGACSDGINFWVTLGASLFPGGSGAVVKF